MEHQESGLRILFAARVLAITVVAILSGSLYLVHEQYISGPRPQVLTNLRHARSHEIVQLRLYMGVQPKPLDCPKGKYRPPGAGITLGECALCPRGVYGDSPGLTSSDCTAKCPKGTYNDRPGAKSVLDCKMCPPGVYGSSPGLTSRACTAPCPYGKYSMKGGLQSASECIDCPPNYRGPNGRRNSNVFNNWDGGYPCDRFINGKTVQTGRDKFNADVLAAYLASERRPNNQINDNT
ncbi:hypothetical protein Poli38472_003027 [Pythium oligandrum]|uniref:Tyrosine-protein kinase ephrin type A/B receptor-like domain-containing protein n=1 Tax=Pythium oligandrum TaxID=41045 RepID=A0A8K1C6T9_PYTOL|nr:hypothetical protein Poli38472_003027 [Pythium oligandrum]|eukprot:TMW57102.1 hypothetical protein Poli38472_003027 [Pythium oligandrum]